MFRLIGRRLLLSVPLLLIVSVSTFVLAAIIPGDIAREIVGPQGSQAQYLALRHSLGLDRPIATRYWIWLTHAIHGDLGISAFTQEHVTTLLDTRLSVTASLVVGSTVLAAILGVSLGVRGALRGGVAGRATDLVGMVGLAIPNFFLGLMLVVWFAVGLRWLPATGYVPLADSPSQWLRSLVLPVVTLAIPSVAAIAKQTRDAMLDVLGQPFIQTLRASGLSERSIVFKHALRSAAIPILTVVALVFVGALSGAVVVESVFALPGLGGLAVQATTQHDLPLIQGVALYFTTIVIVVNLVVDLAYGILDPRVRAA